MSDQPTDTSAVAGSPPATTPSPSTPQEQSNGLDWNFILQEGWGYLESIVFSIIILTAGHIASKVIANALKRLLDKSKRLDAQVKLLSVRLLRVLILIITVVAVLGEFGIETASIIAVLGTLGLAIGLALQGSLSNVASGVLLMVIRPFSVDDIIKSRGQVYIIDEISLFSTRAHLFDGPKVTIPNNQIWGSEIINLSDTIDGIRRIDEVFSIAYSDSIEKAYEVIQEVLDADDRYLKEPDQFIAVTDLGESSVNITCRVWAEPSNWYAAKIDLVKSVKLAFDREGIHIPFPQRDVHLYQDTQTSSTSA